MNSLGDKIREARKSKRLSITEVAQKVGVTRQYISQIETGVQNPSWKILGKICDILNLSYEEMLKIRTDSMVSKLEEQEQKKNSLGYKIKKARISKCLQGQEVAQMVGISHTYFSNIENGRRPPLQVLKKICDVLNLNYAEMLKMGEYPGADSIQSKLNLEGISQEDYELILALIRKVSALTPEEKNSIKFILS